MPPRASRSAASARDTSEVGFLLRREQRERESSSTLFSNALRCVARRDFFISFFSLVQFFQTKKHRHRSFPHELREEVVSVSTRLKRREFDVVESSKKLNHQDDDFLVSCKRRRHQSRKKKRNESGGVDRKRKRKKNSEKTNAREGNRVERCLLLISLSRWALECFFLVSTSFGSGRWRVTMRNCACEMRLLRNSFFFLSFFTLRSLSLDLLLFFVVVHRTQN